MKQGDVVITVSGNPGLPTILAIDVCIHDGFVGLRELRKDVIPAYLDLALLALHGKHGSRSVGFVFKNLTTDQISKFEVALPPLAAQKAIVADIQAEQAVVVANRELIERFEKKIQATMARVWGRTTQHRRRRDSQKKRPPLGAYQSGGIETRQALGISRHGLLRRLRAMGLLLQVRNSG
jgi:hypothetical protein